MILSHNCTTARPQSLALKLSLSLFFSFSVLLCLPQNKRQAMHRTPAFFPSFQKPSPKLRIYFAKLRIYILCPNSVYNTKKGAGAALRRHGPAALVRITKDLTLLTSAASPSHSQLPPLRPPRPPASSPPASSCHPACHRAAAK